MKALALITALSIALVACGDDSSNNGSSIVATNNANDAGSNSGNNSADAGSNSGNSATDAGSNSSTGADAGATDAAMEDSGTADMGGSGCDPYGANTCGAQQMCVPMGQPGDAAATGSCEPLGTAGVGDACDGVAAATTCGHGLVCRNDVCGPICDPAAAMGDPGSCSTGEGCVALFDNGSELPWGSCNDSCLYNHDDPANPTVACDGDSVCFPAEIIGVDFDFCGEAPTMLAVEADCTAAGLEEFELCGVNSLCLDLEGTGQVLCRDLCFPSEGAFGTSGHPDCRNAGNSCEDAFSGMAFGLCL